MDWVSLPLALVFAAAAAQQPAQPPRPPQVPPTLPLTQIDDRALSADLDNRAFSLTFAQPVSLQDVLLRRTGIGQSSCLGLDCAEAIGARMAELCGWSRRRLGAELDAYQQHVDRSLRFRDR